MSNPYQSSADNQGSGQLGPDLGSHVTGNPIRGTAGGSITVGHTWVIIVGALILLWLLGGVLFKSIRM